MNGRDGNMAGTGAQFIRKDLSGYGKASNLKMNEHIKELMSQGQQIYHLAFGQSPFPVPAKLEAGLVKNAHRNEYVCMVGEKLKRLIDPIYFSVVSSFRYACSCSHPAREPLDRGSRTRLQAKIAADSCCYWNFLMFCFIYDRPI